MNMTNVPAIVLSHLSDAQKRMYRIADNKLTELGKWSPELLQIEFKELSVMDVDLDLEITGFETEEIDRFVLGDFKKPNPKEEEIPVMTETDNKCKNGDI